MDNNKNLVGHDEATQVEQTESFRIQVIRKKSALCGDSMLNNTGMNVISKECPSSSYFPTPYLLPRSCFSPLCSCEFLFHLIFLEFPFHPIFLFVLLFILLCFNSWQDKLYIASNRWKIVNDEFGKMCKEVAAACVNTLHRQFAWRDRIKLLNTSVRLAGH